MTIEISYIVRIYIREAEPMVIGPTQLRAVGTTNPEMALESLQERYQQSWVQAIQMGRLWEIESNEQGFLVANPQHVIAIGVYVASAPEQAGSPTTEEEAGEPESEATQRLSQILEVDPSRVGQTAA